MRNLRRLRASDLMTASPMTIEPDDSTKDAIDLMAALGVHHLPVVRDGALVGIVSANALIRIESTPPELERRVLHVMNEQVVTVGPTATLAEVARALIDNRIGAVPVVNQNDRRLLGIVSYVDCLTALADDSSSRTRV